MSDANTALPWNCSGAMYGGLPITVVPCAAISRKRDVPKSATLSMPFSVTRTLAGPQVAMDDAVPVRVIDGVADLAGVVERAVRVERAVARDDRSRACRPARTPSR